MEKNINQQKRQTAFKVRIRDILEGEYVKTEGWDPSYILTRLNKKISRVNLISFIIGKSEKNQFDSFYLLIDDGDSQIACRSFEKNDEFLKVDIGDIVLVIGRPRSYGSEKYIIPEIIKPLNNGWFNYRKKELELLDHNPQGEDINGDEHIIDDADLTVEYNRSSKDVKEIVKEDIVDNDIIGSEEEIEDEKENDNSGSGHFLITGLIRRFDQGPGADQDLVIKESNVENAEDVINFLLKEGEIFEVSPGKLKVLE
ncbi:MAG: hypothetical protein V1740_03345 [Candidatus Woesearchaeota archaeon]